MANKKFWLAISVMILTMFTMAGYAYGQSTSALVGKWIHESGVTRNKPENMELFRDGTGVCDGISISWKAEGGRLRITSALIGLACTYEVSGSRLTLTYDEGGTAIFVKR